MTRRPWVCAGDLDTAPGVAADVLWAAAMPPLSAALSETTKNALVQAVLKYLPPAPSELTPQAEAGSGSARPATYDDQDAFRRWEVGHLVKFLGACKVLGVPLEPQSVERWVDVYCSYADELRRGNRPHARLYWEALGLWQFVPVTSAWMLWHEERRKCCMGPADRMLEMVELQAACPGHRFTQCELREAWSVLAEEARWQEGGWLARSLASVQHGRSRRSVLEVLVCEPWWESAGSFRGFVEGHLLPFMQAEPLWTREYMPTSLRNGLEAMVAMYDVEVPGLEAALAGWDDGDEGAEWEEDREEHWHVQEWYMHEDWLDGRKILQGARTWEEAVEKLQLFTKRVREYQEEGWVLSGIVDEDYGGINLRRAGVSFDD
jgi:hypothetical protein